jgi:hypothetical protein
MPADLGPPDIVLTGRYEKVHERRYAHLPFDVPSGVRQLHLRYAYSDQIDSDPLVTGGNTLDIGLFDERGIAPGSDGFRGWSGSNKAAFTVDEAWATPPYRAGPIGTGTWHVQLGPYKVGPRGCDWRVEIWFDPGLPREARTSTRGGAPRRPALPAPAEPGWLRADLHCHTLYSDGDSWPVEMLHAAAEAGLDVLGVTDHNNAAHHAEYLAAARDLAGAPLVLPGIEVTTYGGHWNAWGVSRWFEYRDPTSEATMRAMAEAAEAGATVSVCHPRPYGPPWQYPEVRGYHAIEAWNGPWAMLNTEALAFWEAHLRRGERVAAVGGSDTHFLRRPHHAVLGGPTTWVDARGARDVAAVLDGLRSGRSFLSATPAGPQLYLRPDTVRVVGAAGATLALHTETGPLTAEAIDAEDQDLRFTVSRGTRYVRAQVTDAAHSMLALTNALWLDA